MGLAAPRKRTKIAHDPNNTNWARSTSGFGHKILSAQGWTPGSFLGARNAAHADMFTAASASHIRVALKDDTLGLGARPKRDLLDEPTGLDAFKGLLGRLNGKSDTEIAADQRKLDDAKLARYVSTRWQTIQFISGGLLAQEKDDSLPAREICSSRKDPAVDVADTGVQKSQTKRNVEIEDISPNRADKKSKRRDKDGKKEKKEKKEKTERKAKKEKKEKKRKRRDDAVNHDEDTLKSESGSESDSQSGSGEGREKPLLAAMPSRERRPGRHLLRGRHIAQKKKALLDDKSLNEIFMVKS